MRSYSNTIAVLMYFFLISCNKTATNDLSGGTSFTGTVALFDTLSGSLYPQTLSNTDVYINITGDSISGYNYFVKSDSTGTFNLNVFDSLKNYTMSVSIDTGKIKYLGQFNYIPGQNMLSSPDTLKVLPDEKHQNGIFYELVDENGGRLPGSTLYLFTSKILSENSDSTGSNYSIHSDAYGRCLQVNVLPGTYYVWALGLYPPLTLKATDEIEVSNTGIVKKMLTLKPQ